MNQHEVHEPTAKAESCTDRIIEGNSQEREHPVVLCSLYRFLLMILSFVKFGSLGLLSDFGLRPSGLIRLAFATKVRHSSPVNTASQDLARHLEVLRQKLEHPTDYELALTYFLDEFAGDVKFVNQSDQEEAPHLLAVLRHAAGKLLGNPPELAQSRVLRLNQFQFTHGNAILAGRVLLFFFFEETNLGLLALIPGVRGGTEVGRFRLEGALAGNPKHN
jgi:hypothetical protein